MQIIVLIQMLIDLNPNVGIVNAFANLQNESVVSDHMASAVLSVEYSVMDFGLPR